VFHLSAVIFDLFADKHIVFSVRFLSFFCGMQVLIFAVPVRYNFNSENPDKRHCNPRSSRLAPQEQG